MLCYSVMALSPRRNNKVSFNTKDIVYIRRPGAAELTGKNARDSLSRLSRSIQLTMPGWRLFFSAPIVSSPH